ncbi:Solute carrier family 25 member 39 [Bagarius yarrelli]|uniref:Mitochondrial glutathione transporter SLC25A39 n=1 Tax=Bagarius yarrelli TaxID=175774 RepID=A0A556UZX8_BAGYA|nr:Solute carrier family 25 member 39 [Bagarius yarrelli]
MASVTIVTTRQSSPVVWQDVSPVLIPVPHFSAFDVFDFIPIVNNFNSLSFYLSFILQLFYGCFSVGAVTVITPLELVRTKMQYRRVSYSELRVCIRSAVTQNGVLSLWRGWGPTVLRDVPFSAMYWFNYELLKAELCERYRTPQASFPISFAAGAASGTVAAITTLPFDVVKTRRQIELGEADLLEAPLKKPSSTWVIMKSIWNDTGYRGLFAVYMLPPGGRFENCMQNHHYSRLFSCSGFLPRVIKVAPACAIMISTYEFGKSFFRQYNQEQRVG